MFLGFWHWRRMCLPLAFSQNHWLWCYKKVSNGNRFTWNCYFSKKRCLILIPFHTFKAALFQFQGGIVSWQPVEVSHGKHKGIKGAQGSFFIQIIISLDLSFKLASFKQYYISVFWLKKTWNKPQLTWCHNTLSFCSSYSRHRTFAWAGSQCLGKSRTCTQRLVEWTGPRTLATDKHVRNQIHNVFHK